MIDRIVIGTRASDLALVQTRMVAALLENVQPHLQVDEKHVRTTGDLRLDVSLHAPGPLDKGLFTRELETAILDGTVDIAVHSLKDLPTENPAGLVLGAIIERADPADVLISRRSGGLEALPPGAVVATSSPRRKNQLLHLRPDVEVRDIRGNVPTRLRRLAESDELAGIVLAKAGLDRLGPGVVPPDLHVSILEHMLPAPGQGAIAVQCREADSAILGLLSAIHHEPTSRCVHAERALLSRLGGGCHLPLGTLATIQNDGSILVRAALFEAGQVRSLDQVIPADEEPPAVCSSSFT